MKLGRRAIPVLSLGIGIAGFVLLQTVVGLGWVSSYIVPPPSAMLAVIPRLFVEEALLLKFLLTFSLIFSATLAAALLGIPLGWLLYRIPTLGRAYEAWIGAAFSAPLVLLYPLFMVVFGRGVIALFAIGVLAGVAPITLHSLQALRSVPRVYLNVARSFNMSEPQIAIKVLFPAALVTIFTGIRLGLIYIMTYVVAVEFLVNLGGLGHLIGDLYSRYSIPEMYGAILFVVLTSVLLFAGMERAERWMKSL